MARFKVDPVQIEFLNDRMSWMAGKQEGLGDLFNKLLEEGGLAVAAQFEEDLEKILRRGQRFSPKGLRMKQGQHSACHANSARLFEVNPEAFKVVTGYALSDDGVWRQHTWGLEHGKVVETTERRLMYFGFILTPEETEDFCYNN